MNARLENGKHAGTMPKGLRRSLRMGLRAGALTAAMLLLGCQDSPDPEVATTRTAIEAARQAGAEKSSQSTLLEATHYLDSALQDIDAQKKAFIGRDYANARRLLQKAGDKAREAQASALRTSIEQDILAKAAAAKNAPSPDSLSLSPGNGPSAPESMRRSAESAINLTYAGYQKARRQAGPNSKAALESILQGLKDARTALKGKDYPKALSLAGVAKAKLDSLPR
jgi:hypothetical protein